MDFVNASATRFLYAEIIRYHQSKVSGIDEFEQRLKNTGKEIGYRLFNSMTSRIETKKTGSAFRLIDVIYFVNTDLWTALFGKSADSLEKNTEREECMFFKIGLSWQT